MTAAELVHGELKRLHEALDGSLTGLTPEQRHAVPHPQANSIAWVVWHVVRTEDGIVRWVIQNRRTPVWTEGGYAEKLGLPPVSANVARSVPSPCTRKCPDTVPA